MRWEVQGDRGVRTRSCTAYSRLVRPLVAGLTYGLVWCALTGSASAAVVGVNADVTWGITSSEVHTELSMVRAASVRWVRASISLAAAEYWGPGRLNRPYLRRIDAVIRAARAAGSNVLMELDRTPYWASADPAKYADASGLHWRPYWAYRHARDYARVVVAMVNRYKRMGVSAFELWNEPNNTAFWPSGVNAVAYARLLKVAYPAIKANDPRATVLMGGLMPARAYGFLKALYDAGGRGFYDAANFHIYPAADPSVCARVHGRPATNSFCLLRGLRREMISHGDRSSVWVTELGWSTCTEAGCVTPSQQGSYVTDACRLLASPLYSWVAKVFVYQMRDLYWDTSHSAWDVSQ